MKTIEEMSSLEIKGLVYDEMAKMENCQKNIVELNKLIAQKAQEEAKVEPKMERL